MWKSTNCKVCDVVFTLENKKKKRGSCIECYKEEARIRARRDGFRHRETAKKFKEEVLNK